MVSRSREGLGALLDLPGVRNAFQYIIQGRLAENLG